MIRFLSREYVGASSGLLVPKSSAKRKKRPIAFDFFCGAGGFGLGFINAGFEIVGANEFDAAASLTYMVNLGHYPMTIHYLDGEEGKRKLDQAVAKAWGIKGKEYNYKGGVTPEAMRKAFGNEILLRGYPVAGSGWIKKHPDTPGVRNFWFGDIHKLKGADILNALGLRPGDLDAVIGGPPCQGFSRSGKQKIDDTRNTLIYDYARLITELQPKTFVMEEVPDIINFFDPDGVPVLDKFCMLLEDGGYGKWDMLKKSLLMQTSAAAGMRSTLRGNEKIKRARRPKRAVKPQEPLASKPDSQPCLFAEV